MSERVRPIFASTPPPPPHLSLPTPLLPIEPTSSVPLTSATPSPPPPFSSSPSPASTLLSSARSAVSSALTPRNSLIALTSITAIGVTYFLYRRFSTPRSLRPSHPTTPPPHTHAHPEPSTPPSCSPPSLLSRILHPPPPPRKHSPPPALTISPAQAAATLRAETQADVYAGTGIALERGGEERGGEREEGREGLGEVGRGEGRGGLMARLKEETEEDEKEDAASLIAPLVRRPMVHYHPPRLIHPRVPSSPVTSQESPSPVAAPSAATATTPPAALPVAVSVSASVPVTRTEGTREPGEAAEARAASPAVREAPVVLGNVLGVSAQLQSPSFTPIILRTPLLPSHSAPSPPLPSTSSSPVPADASLALTTSAAAASPLSSTSTALIPSSLSSSTSALPPSTPPTYFSTVPPAFATMPFTAADGSPHILAFITDPASSLIAVAAQPASTSLSPALLSPSTSLIASSTGAPPVEGGALRVDHLITRSTLLVELLAVLVLLIAVLAAAVDTRWLLPLAPIVAYVLFVCAHAVRAQPQSSVLFPAALFPFLYPPPPPSSSSASPASSFTSLVPRALFPASHATIREVGNSPLSPPPPLTSSTSAPGVTSAVLSPVSVPLYPLPAALEQPTPPTPASSALSVTSDVTSPIPTPMPDSSAAATQTANDEVQEAEVNEENGGAEPSDDPHLCTPPRREAWREKRSVSFGHGYPTTSSISDEAGVDSGEEKERAQPPSHADGISISPSSPFHSRDSAAAPSSSFSSTASSVSSSDAESDSTAGLADASSASPSPTSSSSSSSSPSLSSASLADRETAFFPPEPVADLSGSSTSSIAVKFTYRQRWEDVVQAFWDLTSPDWERTGHSLGLADSRLATPPSGASGTSVSGSPRSGGSGGLSGDGGGAVGVEEVSHAVTEMWRSSSSPSSLFIRRQLTVHTKVPGVVKKVVGPTKRVVLEERAVLDAAQRLFRLQVNNSRFRRFILVHETRSFSVHPEHSDWTVLQCHFRVVLLPACGLLKQTVYKWVSGTWKQKQQDMGRRIAQRVELLALNQTHQQGVGHEGAAGDGGRTPGTRPPVLRAMDGPLAVDSVGGDRREGSEQRTLSSPRIA